jgi:transposase-like protein
VLIWLQNCAPIRQSIQLENSPMVLEPIRCPNCDSINVVRHGRTAQGKQRYLCRNQNCCHCTFIQQYTYRSYLSEVKEQITDMAVNGSGMRDTARVLKISRNTVTAVLKKNFPNYSK